MNTGTGKNILGEHREIEVRFLEIDVPKLKQALLKAGAKDLGEDFLDETILYDSALTWRDQEKCLRLRTKRGKTTLSYKHHQRATADGTEEIEFDVSNPSAAEALLSKLGFLAFRKQEKRRHTFLFEDVVVDIDSWPRIPTFVELEGPSELALKRAAKTLGLDWKSVVMKDVKVVIEERYGIPVSRMTHFTFSRFE